MTCDAVLMAGTWSKCYRMGGRVWGGGGVDHDETVLGNCDRLTFGTLCCEMLYTQEKHLFVALKV